MENCQVEKEEDEAETAVDEGALGLDLLLSERDRMDEETRNARGPVTRTAPAKRGGTSLGAATKLPRLEPDLPVAGQQQLGIQQFLITPRNIAGG